MANTYYRGQGKVWIASRNSAGRTSGFAEIGDAEAFSISPSESFDDVYESQSGSRQQVVHSSTQLSLAFELTVLNFSGANLARALLGTSAAVVGAAVVGESIKAYKGSSVFLKYPGVTTVTIGALVAGTDFIVDGASGRIDFPTASAVTDGASVTVNYTHGGVKALAEAFTTADNREYVVVFEGKNMNQQGTPVIVRAHRAYMNATSALALLGSATGRFTMGGSLLPAEEIVGAGLSKFMNLTIKDLN